MGAILWVKVVCSGSYHQLTGESPIEVIAGEPCSKLPVLLGEDCAEVRYAYVK